MSSRPGALIAPPSWGRALHPDPAERARRLDVVRAPRVRWGIRAPAWSGAGGAAVLAATAGLWIAFFLAAW